MEYQFLIVMGAMFFALLSPGPDFALILNQSIKYGIKTSIYTSFGLGFGVFLHSLYSILGLGIIISQSIIVYNIIKFLGAFYLFYIGYKSLKSKGFKLSSENGVAKESISNFKAFNLGFLCNILNPKAALFFISLFSVIIDPQTPMNFKAFYTFCIVSMTISWFCTLSFILSHKKVREFFNKFGTYFDRAIGTILILLALKIAFFDKNS